MKAVFVIGNGPEASLDEAAALAAVAAKQPPDTDDGGLVGCIVISADGQPALAVRDDLEFLVGNLCLAAPATLASQGRVVVPMANRPTTITLLVNGDEVQVLDEAGAVLGRYPQHALAAALRGCAERFTAYVGALAALDGAWTPLHKLLQARLATAG